VAQIPSSGGVLLEQNGFLIWVGLVLLLLLVLGMIHHFRLLSKS
jgi:hypothetical protein